VSSQPFPTATEADPAVSGPLIVSADPALVDGLRRLAVVSGAVPQLVATASAARQLWAAAPVVLVGDDRAAELGTIGLPRRAAVLLVVPDAIEPAAWQQAVVIGAEGVVSVRDDRDRLVEVLGVSTEGRIEAPVLCVTGGCGGAGASVFAAALARAGLARGLSSVLVDADPWGGGADLLVGGEDVGGLRWPDLAATTGRVSAASLRAVLPVVDDLAVLSWGRGEPEPVAPGSMRSLLTAARRGHGLVVVDVPRGADDVALEALALASTTVLVVPTGVRAVAAARTRLAALRRATVRLCLVVRTTGVAGLDGGDVADALGLPLLAQMRAERALAGWLEQGLGLPRRTRGQLASAAAITLAACAPTVATGVKGG